MQPKIDLHGIKHEDVKSVVIKFIESHWGSDKEGIIVYGNSDRMRTMVQEIIEEYNLNYKEGKFGDLTIISTTIHFE